MVSFNKLKSVDFHGRRGAGFGIAGVVKGLGIASLRGYGILDALKASIEDKTDALAREGALFAFECLVEKLGRLFEPYVIHVLPFLLVCFGDLSPAVREATDSAARSIMSNLSGQGGTPPPPTSFKGPHAPHVQHMIYGQQVFWLSSDVASVPRHTYLRPSSRMWKKKTGLTVHGVPRTEIILIKLLNDFSTRTPRNA